MIIAIWKLISEGNGIDDKSHKYAVQRVGAEKKVTGWNRDGPNEIISEMGEKLGTLFSGQAHASAAALGCFRGHINTN